MTQPYQGGDLSEIARAMNERYEGGDAYVYELPFDVMLHDALHGAVAKLVKECLRDYEGSFPLRLTDLGCGTKTVFEKQVFRDAMIRFRYVQATMADLSKVAIEHLCKSQEDIQSIWGGTLSTQCVVCPAENLSSWASHQHMVISVESIEHWSDVEACLAGIKNALLPGGYFILTTPNRDSLHVRMARKLGFEPPFCSSDHTYEFGYKELDGLLSDAGFEKVGELGAGMAPYWALEGVIGGAIRNLTDNDPEVNQWLNTVGERCPEFSFCQVKAFRRKL